MSPEDAPPEPRPSDPDRVTRPEVERLKAGFVKPGADASQAPEHIAQFFAYAHLPPHLQAVSKPFADLAAFVLTLPRNPERTVALRKLLEGKDAAVRAALAVG